MEKIENLNESELVELWQQLQSLTQEETRDCGDVALLWHLAEKLDLSRSYEGNVVDVTRFPKAVEDLSQQYPEWRPMIISDCGVISDETLVMMRHLGYGMLLGLPRKGRWLSIMLGVSESQFDSGFYYRGTHIRAKRKGVNLGGHRFHVYVFLSKKKAKREAEAREKAICACEAELRSLNLGVRFLKTRAQMKERVKTILAEHKVSKFLHVQVVKPRSSKQFELRIQCRKRALKNQAKLDGRSMVITAPWEMPPKEAYITYRSGRHSVESAFGMVKDPVSIRPVFVHNEQRIKGHIFICQLALLLRRVLEMLLKLSGIQITSRRALRQVKSVRIAKKTLSGISESLWQLNRIPEEIQRIFDAVDLDLQQYLRNLQLPLPP